MRSADNKGVLEDFLRTHGPLRAGIVSSPAVLESTALVLAHGLDVFVTRVQPSRTFDLIPDDFPYAFLITVTLVLAIAALALRRVEASSTVTKKWT